MNKEKTKTPKSRTIAATAMADHKTVATVRAEKEGRGEFPHVEARTDIKGRKQPTKKRRTPEDFRRDVEEKKRTERDPDSSTPRDKNAELRASAARIADKYISRDGSNPYGVATQLEVAGNTYFKIVKTLPKLERINQVHRMLDALDLAIHKDFVDA